MLNTAIEFSNYVSIDKVACICYNFVPYMYNSFVGWIHVFKLIVEIEGVLYSSFINMWKKNQSMKLNKSLLLDLLLNKVTYCDSVLNITYEYFVLTYLRHNWIWTSLSQFNTYNVNNSTKYLTLKCIYSLNEIQALGIYDEMLVV